MDDLDGSGSVEQSVAVILNPIRPDRQELFESIVARIRALVEEQFPDIIPTVRFLRPTEADEHGNVTYVFLFDPFYPDFNYNIDRLVYAAFEPPEAEAFLEEWSDCFASPQVLHRLEEV